MTFKDHFSETAAGDVRFRPRYPEALFDYLAGAVPRLLRYPLPLRIGRKEGP